MSWFYLLTLISLAGWGTKRHTPGSAVQLPRKVPLRLEPKAFFAVERTFLSWMGMSIALATASTVLSSLVASNGDADEAGLLSRQAVAAIALLFAPAGFIILVYAFSIYLFRSRVMRSKELGFYNDSYGPIVMTCIVAFLLLVITVTSYYAFL
jgi:uncharacterized membrane protein YidH (DUF202 family)